ncbi:Metastasis-associated protein MTA3 [Hypsibius exemplaris]|uniref:Metastasis-associated protein MTA3 n=1 Tax=Hypsibius exemplaris TaxID=2072580 RepID=A0A1W0X957_HYPEX|nr:Metastasis-associated protein MTA3 [Hypsibius exemplaris]
MAAAAALPTNPTANANLYKAGDFCYFEVASSGPYQIRRIEELIKTSNSHVEVRATAYCRKRDLPTKLQERIANYEKDRKEVPDIFMDGQDDDDNDLTSSPAKNGEKNGNGEVNEEKLREHRIGHREIYLTRLVENLPASLIRGKCTVHLLVDWEAKATYLREDDVYFYTHTWDPNTKSLSREKGGDIRVGSGFQAEVPSNPTLEEFPSERAESNPVVVASVPGEAPKADPVTGDALVWLPNKMTDTEIDNFLMVMRSVGTMGRALDGNSNTKQPGLHITAAAASRDITIASGLDVLHCSNYELSKALTEIVAEGPLICRDQMELWTATEAGLFEEALVKYGKDFEEIKKDLLSWKTMCQIIEYYYMWKTSDRFVQRKRLKQADQDGRLKQIYIPAYVMDDQPSSNDGPDTVKVCEGCHATQSPNWYAWNGFAGVRGPEKNRLCRSCWTYWKKYGDLVRPVAGEKKVMLHYGPGIPYAVHQKAGAVADGHFAAAAAGGDKKGYLLPPNQRSSAHLGNFGYMPPRTSYRTRPAIYFIATQMMKEVRRVGEHIFKPRRAARRPFHWINSAPIKEFYQNADAASVQRSKETRSRKKVFVETVAQRLLESSGPNDPRIRSAVVYTKDAQSGGGTAAARNSSTIERIPSPHAKRMKIDPGDVGAPSKLVIRGRDRYGRLIAPNSPEDFFYHLSPALKTERKKYMKTVELKKAGRSQRNMMDSVPSVLSRLQNFLGIVSASSSVPPVVAAVNIPEVPALATAAVTTAEVPNN